MSTALIVIDMQNDYLWPSRKPMFAYDTDALVASVNALVRRYAEEGCDIVYIRHIIQNLPTNRLLFGYSLAGTEGAELYGGLEIVSDHCFDKLVGDALSNGRLRDLIREKGYEKLRLCGLDECGCVTSTALGDTPNSVMYGSSGMSWMFGKNRLEPASMLTSKPENTFSPRFTYNRINEVLTSILFRTGKDEISEPHAIKLNLILKLPISIDVIWTRYPTIFFTRNAKHHANHSKKTNKIFLHFVV